MGASDMSEESKAPAEKPRRKMVRVRAAHDGYRRAGRAWSRTPTEVDDLTKEQLAALEADPRITVE